MGGTSIYKASFESNCFKRLYLTRIFGDFKCDVFLEPANFLDGFTKVESESLLNEMVLYECEYNERKRDSTNGIEYVFEVYSSLKCI